MDAALQSISADVATFQTMMDWANARGDQLTALRIASVVPIALIGERRQIITDLLVRVGAAADGTGRRRRVRDPGGTWPTTKATGGRHPRPTRSRGTTSSRPAPTAMRHGPTTARRTRAWLMGDLPEVDRLNAKAIALFRNEADPVGLGYTLWVASVRTSDLDEAQRLAAEADELLRSDRLADGDRAHRRRTRDHRLRPG